MRSRPLIGLGLILLLLPNGTAQPDEALMGTSATLDGLATMEAVPVGLVARNVSLHADQIHIEVTSGTLTINEQRVDVWTAGIGATPANETSEKQEVAQASLTGFILQPTYRVVLVPAQAAVQANLSLASWSLAPVGTQDHPPWASHLGQHMRFETTDSLRHEQSAGVLSLAGSFRLAIWGADFTLNDASGTSAVHTGSDRESVAPRVERRTEREVILEVASGTLTFPMASGVEAYLKETTLAQSLGRLTIHGPSGVLPIEDEAVPPDSKILRIDAPFEAQLDAAESGLHLTFPSPPQGATLDGRALRVPPGTPTWLYAVGFLALAAIPAGATAIRHGQHKKRLRNLDASMRSKDLDEGLATARRIRRSRPRNQDALVAETLGLIHSKRYDEAVQVLGAKGWTATLYPLREFLMAAAESGRGKREAAVQWLASCLSKAPAMALEASAAPLLSSLVREAQERARQGLAGPGAAPGHT